MALPLPPGLTPPEAAFLCEMELVTVIPRQRLESLDLLGGPTPPLTPPHRANIPLWLALLLKRQGRANIVPPPWLQPLALANILEFETEHAPDAFSPAPPLPNNPNPTRNTNTANNTTTTTTTTTTTPPPPPPITPSPPFLPSATATSPPTALPYHWLELGQILLDAAGDDFTFGGAGTGGGTGAGNDADAVRRLLRDLREVRLAKLRAGVDVLGSGDASVHMNGVGAMEVAEGRGFVAGVVDGLRRIGASREQARREREREELGGGGGGGGGGTGGGGGGYYDDDDDGDDVMDL